MTDEKMEDYAGKVRDKLLKKCDLSGAKEVKFDEKSEVELKDTKMPSKVDFSKIGKGEMGE